MTHTTAPPIELVKPGDRYLTIVGPLATLGVGQMIPAGTPATYVEQCKPRPGRDVWHLFETADGWRFPVLLDMVTPIQRCEDCPADVAYSETFSGFRHLELVDEPSTPCPLSAEEVWIP